MSKVKKNRAVWNHTLGELEPEAMAFPEVCRCQGQADPGLDLLALFLAEVRGRMHKGLRYELQGSPIPRVPFPFTSASTSS